ncbi:alpha-2-macroglobulin [Klebsormidium nitens]|uniref:Alpha-2-macroglobulin n=1 Tax=Klebsormidium nitens TaxID=105231 RepID=A0A1Y1HV73_KLENI|nr:alpha-2-macroglobulin [Klebsormidium nitens]|eukprot:GAQ82063.1 alpha-2-macroglobulin [Klebsormidium nitens]
MDVDAPGDPPATSTTLKQTLEGAESVREIVRFVAGGAALTAASKANPDEPTPLARGSVTVNAAASVRGGPKRGGQLHKDSVKRTFAVSPKGFPQEQSVGGMLKPGGENRVGGEFALPEDTQPGSVVTSVTVFPSPVASLTSAAQALVREPYGCFEQTSAAVFPNVMAQQYFKTHPGASPKLMEKSYMLLGSGLERLRGFEVEGSGGYDWFGKAPAHEALTAYGLQLFTDMAQVYPVPKDMIRRTRDWLLSRKNDTTRAFNMHTYTVWGGVGAAPADVNNAYIVWSLTCANMGDSLEPQIASLVEQAATNKDPYFVAMVADTLYKVGRKDEAGQLARGLQKHQKADGSVRGATTSITRSGGDSLLVETTALVALCWLNDVETFGAAARRAIDWIATRCAGGRFGSTQATVLALKAIVRYDVAVTSARAPGTVHLVVDGERVESIAYGAGAVGAIAFGDVAPRMKADGRARNVEVEMEGGALMPCAIQLRYHSERPPSAAADAVALRVALAQPAARDGDLVEVLVTEKPDEALPIRPMTFRFPPQVRYHSERPPSAPAAAVALRVALAQPAAREGDLVEVLVTLNNTKPDEELPMTVAIVGLPGGLEPRHDQLKELVTRGDVAFYEIRGREVIFYWRALAANQTVALRVETTAAVPGEYIGPASRAYLYYTDELKTWAEPLKCSIAPK